MLKPVSNTKLTNVSCVFCRTVETSCGPTAEEHPSSPHQIPSTGMLWSAQWTDMSAASVTRVNWSDLIFIKTRSNLLQLIKHKGFSELWRTCVPSAAVAVSNGGAGVLLSQRGRRAAEGPVWITWRTALLPELCWQLFSLESADHREGVLHTLYLWWLSCRREGVSGGRGLHRWDSLDPGRRRWTDSDLIHFTWRGVFITSCLETVSCNWVPRWLFILSKLGC